jgi:hypothetical protein
MGGARQCTPEIPFDLVHGPSKQLQGASTVPALSLHTGFILNQRTVFQWRACSHNRRQPRKRSHARPGSIAAKGHEGCS